VDFRTRLLEWYDKNKRELPWRMNDDEDQTWTRIQKGYRGNLLHFDELRWIRRRRNNND
jgi:hypothetical protein